MFRVDRRLLQNVDWALLVTAGVILVFSAATLKSLHVDRAGGGVFGRQLAWFCLGALVLIVVASLDYRRIVQAAPVFYVAGLAALATVLVMGRTVSGARRWIGVGPFTVQPSEMFKIA